MRVLAQNLGLHADGCRITSTDERLPGEGSAELVHADLTILVVPRGLLAHREVSFWHCREGRVAGPMFDAPIAELLDPDAFARRLRATLGAWRSSPLPRAA